MADKLNAYQNDKVVATAERGESGKATVKVKTDANKDYAKGDIKIAWENENGEGEKIDVEAFKTKPISVTSVALNNTKLSLDTGKTATLKATVKPDNATNKGVNWASDNEDVATVDNSGKVTAVKAGTANIKVGTKDGNKSAQCAVTVKDPVVNVTGVSLDKTELSVEEGATAQLKATVAPANATNKGIAWASDNNAVATIKNGTVTGVKEGKANVAVHTNDGDKKAIAKIIVTAKPALAPEPPAEG